MKLFALRPNTSNGGAIKGLHFPNKQAAKAARDSGEHGHSLVVCPGPDHCRNAK